MWTGPRTVRYDLDAAHCGLFHDITMAIGALTMARYRPSAYLVGGAEAVAEATLAGLLQSGVLKPSSPAGGPTSRRSSE